MSNMDKDYVLSEIEFAINHLTSLRKEISEVDWKLNSDIIANEIASILCKGRSGLSYFVNCIPMMEYRLNNYKESGDVEDLDNFMKIANSYMDAVVKVREAFNMLDSLYIKLIREHSDASGS